MQESLAKTLQVYRYTAKIDFNLKKGMTALSDFIQPTQREHAKGFDSFNNKSLEQKLLTDVLISLRDAHSDVIGLTRNTGGGDEYVFFSKTAIGVLEVELFQV